MLRIPLIRGVDWSTWVASWVTFRFALSLFEASYFPRPTSTAFLSDDYSALRERIRDRIVRLYFLPKICDLPQRCKVFGMTGQRACGGVAFGTRFPVSSTCDVYLLPCA